MNLLDLEISAWITRYLEERATLDEFEDWFVPATWGVEHTGNLSAVEVATGVRASLAELSAGALDEDAFKDQLRVLESHRPERLRMCCTLQYI